MGIIARARKISRMPLKEIIDKVQKRRQWRKEVECLQMVAAADFLRSYPERGKSVDIYPGLQGYAITNCLCAGIGQVLLPVFPNGKPPVILSESYNYATHTAESLRANLLHGGAQKREILEEAVPLYPLFSAPFSHWVLECLPKLLAMEHSGYKGVYIVPQNPDATHVEEFFELFGIAGERIRYNDKKYLVRRLIVPQSLRMRDLINHAPLFFLLRDSLRERVGVLPGSRNVYVKRVGTRRFLNEDDVLEVLRFYDFETMIPEEHDVKGEFRFMTNASCSLMASGSNLTTSLVAQEKSALVEICNTRHVNYPTPFIPNLLGMQWFPLCFMPSNEYPSEMHLHDDHANIRVNCTVLRTILENILGKKMNSPHSLRYLECG